MQLELIIAIIAWLLVGAICAAYALMDMRKSKDVKAAWLAITFLLSVVGLVLYIFLVKKKRVDVTFPPKPEYSAPAYKFDKVEKKSAAEEEAAKLKPVVKQTEGIPRCPDCGAAISDRDLNCPRCGRKLR
jgi:DNA-directed RNA polymerase subunit RPC12/RpoP